jgi:hypothetical protein
MPWQPTPTVGYVGGARDCRPDSSSTSWVVTQLANDKAPPNVGTVETDGSLADVNGDGILDRIGVTSMGTGGSQLSVALGLGDGTFTKVAVAWGAPVARPFAPWDPVGQSEQLRGNHE